MDQELTIILENIKEETRTHCGRVGYLEKLAKIVNAIASADEKEYFKMLIK